MGGTLSHCTSSAMDTEIGRHVHCDTDHTAFLAVIGRVWVCLGCGVPFTHKACESNIACEPCPKCVVTSCSQCVVPSCCLEDELKYRVVAILMHSKKEITDLQIASTRKVPFSRNCKRVHNLTGRRIEVPCCCNVDALPLGTTQNDEFRQSAKFRFEEHAELCNSL